MRLISDTSFVEGGADEPSLKLIDATTLATGDEFPMNSLPTSENTYSRHFVNKPP
jgi:hypothetical protein